MTNFRTAILKLGPRWLTEGEGGLVLTSLGLVLDEFAERALLGLCARFPSLAPDDALAPLGRDRGIIRGIGESRASYVARLLDWLDDHLNAGNPFALMKQIQGYLGLPVKIRTVDTRGNWFTRDEAGAESFSLDQGNWNWDGVASKWSRFWVIIYSPSGVPWSPEGAWGDGALWGDAGVWGSSISLDQLNSLRAIVDTWKPAGTRCPNIIIAFDPASFDPAGLPGSPGLPDGTWGHWSKLVGGARVPSRLGTARYADGVV